MKINLDNTQNVKPVGGSLKFPNPYESRKRVYEAEREGYEELGRAAANVGRAVAYCGELLTRYDQETLKRNFATDIESYKIRRAELYQAELDALRKNPNQPKNKEEFEQAFEGINQRVSAQINKEVDEGLVRNADRWQKELGEMDSVQSASAKLTATKSWILEQENRERKIFDTQLSFYTQHKDKDGVDATINARIDSDPANKELYVLKREIALSKIELGEVADIVNRGAESVGLTLQENLAFIWQQRVDNLQNADEEFKRLEPEERQKKMEEIEALSLQQGLNEIQGFVDSELQKAYAEIDSKAYVSESDKETAKRNAREHFADAKKAAVSDFTTKHNEEAKARTESFKAAMKRGIEDIGTEPSLMHLAVNDSMLNGADPEEAQYKFVEKSMATGQVALAARIQITGLSSDSAKFGDRAMAILETARKRGISREEYEPLLAAVKLKSNGATKMDNALSNALSVRVLKHVNEIYGTNYETLEKAITSDETVEVVDRFLSAIENIGLVSNDYTFCTQQIDAEFNVIKRSSDAKKALQVTSDRIASLLKGWNDVNLLSPEGVIAARDASRSRILGEQGKEDDEKTDQRKQAERPHGGFFTLGGAGH